jgi:hypothetical protein
MSNKIFHLKESKTFCMLGFMHSHTWPDGRVLPCCAGDINAPNQLGNVYETPWSDIWNGQEYTKLRADMLAEQENPLCKYCYDTEKLRGHSMRTNMNATFAHLYDNILATVDDASGYCGSDKLYYMDFRFSNLCNQACITCGHDLSSSWYDLLHDMNPEGKVERPKFLIAGNKANPYPAIIDNSINEVEVIYFAGGEPLLVPEHWQILEQLIDNGRAKDVSLRYSTNLGTLKYKGKHVLDYWNKFKTVNVAASVDEVSDRFHYIRWPAEWAKISSNIKSIVDSWDRPGNQTHELTFSPVISLMNAHRLKDMVEQWGNEGLIQQNMLYNKNTFETLLLDNILRGPAQFYTGNAPDWWWEETLLPKLDEFERWYKQTIIRHKHDPATRTNAEQIVKHGIDAIRNTRNLDVKSVNSDTGRPGNFDVNFWIDWLGRVDGARKTKWAETFPELAWMINQDWRKNA